MIFWLLHVICLSFILAEGVYYQCSDDNRKIKYINESVGIVHNAGTTFYPFIYTSDYNPSVAIKRFCIKAEVEDDTCTIFTQSIKGMLSSSELDLLSIGSFIDDILVGPVIVNMFARGIEFNFNLEMLTTSSDADGVNLARTVPVTLPISVLEEAPLWQSCTTDSALEVCRHMWAVCREEHVMLSSCGELVHELDMRLLRPLTAAIASGETPVVILGIVEPSLLAIPLVTYLDGMHHTFEWDMFYFSFTADVDSFVPVMDTVYDHIPTVAVPSRLFYYSSGYLFFVTDGEARMCRENALTTVACARFIDALLEEFQSYYGAPPSRGSAAYHVYTAIDDEVSGNVNNGGIPDIGAIGHGAPVSVSPRVTALAALVRDKHSSLAVFRFILGRLVAIMEVRTERVASYVDANADKSFLVDIDFIEIGTSNFDTIVQLLGDNDSPVAQLTGVRGLVVEPVVSYLDSLPSIPGVEKINAAITGAAGGVDTLDLYYIPLELIEGLSLPAWLRGCNSIGSYHPQHIALNLTEYVSIVPVPVVPISAFLQQHGVRGVKVLKIDTEGFDVPILNGYVSYLNSQYPCPVGKWHLDKSSDNISARGCLKYYPDAIIFEVNSDLISEVTATTKILINKYLATGIYQVIATGGDCILEKLPHLVH